MTRKRLKSHRSGAQICLLAVICMLLACCASVPPPTALLGRARASLQAAEAADARVYAPLELTFAQGKLSQAETAMQDKGYSLAADLAAESQAESALAKVKSDLGKVREQIKQQSAENSKLRANLLKQGNNGNGSGT